MPKRPWPAMVRQYAVDYGNDGIRANAVNADRIRSGLLTEDMTRPAASAKRATLCGACEASIPKDEATDLEDVPKSSAAWRFVNYLRNSSVQGS
jgi:hypothetical protein